METKIGVIVRLCTYLHSESDCLAGSHDYCAGALAWDNVLSSWTRHFTLTVALSTMCIDRYTSESNAWL